MIEKLYETVNNLNYFKSTLQMNIKNVMYYRNNTKMCDQYS